jgi:hypothetical protein
MNLDRIASARHHLYLALANCGIAIDENADETLKRWTDSTELNRVISKMTRRDLYRTLFNRNPEAGWGVSNISSLNAPVTADLLHEFIFSEENRTCGHLIYAETFRAPAIVFVHIPKTAGTSINVALEKSCTLLTNDDIFSISDLISRYSEGPPNRPVVLSGHRTLSFYEQYFPLHRVDQIFTVVRDPIDLAISFFNYAMDKLHGTDNAWLARHSSSVSAWKHSSNDIKSTFHNYLDSRFFSENVTNIYCKYLNSGGSENQKDASRQTIDNLARLGVTVVRIDKTTEFISTICPTPDIGSMANISPKLITRDDLSYDEVDNIRQRLESDYSFFHALDNFADWRHHGILRMSAQR